MLFRSTQSSCPVRPGSVRSSLGVGSGRALIHDHLAGCRPHPRAHYPLRQPTACPQPVLRSPKGGGGSRFFPGHSRTNSRALPASDSKITPAESALTQVATLTPLESALTEIVRKPFGICTYKKRGAGGGRLLLPNRLLWRGGLSRRPRTVRRSQFASLHRAPGIYKSPPVRQNGEIDFCSSMIA
jgi:hypothetical protein